MSRKCCYGACVWSWNPKVGMGTQTERNMILWLHPSDKQILVLFVLQWSIDPVTRQICACQVETTVKVGQKYEQNNSDPKSNSSSSETEHISHFRFFLNNS